MSPDVSRALTITEPGARSTTDGLPATVSVPRAVAPPHAPALRDPCQSSPALFQNTSMAVLAALADGSAESGVEVSRSAPDQPHAAPVSAQRSPDASRQKTVSEPCPALATTGLPPTAPVPSGVAPLQVPLKRSTQRPLSEPFQTTSMRPAAGDTARGSDPSGPKPSDTGVAHIPPPNHPAMKLVYQRLWSSRSEERRVGKE